MKSPKALRLRSPGGLVATVFLIIVVVAASIAVLTHHGHGHESASTPSTTTTPTTDSGGGFAAPATDVYGRRVDVPIDVSGQPLSQTDSPIGQTDPGWLTAPPAGTHDRGGWQRVYGVSVPFSTTDGPARISKGMASGYARTPRGAALAAVYIAHQLAARPADPDVVARVAYGPDDLARWREGVATGKLPTHQSESVTRWITAPDAYQIVSWSPDLCVLTVAGRANPGGPQQAPTWTSVRYAVAWTGGDWNLLPDSGIGENEQLVSILGWTPW